PPSVPPPTTTPAPTQPPAQPTTPPGGSTTSPGSTGSSGGSSEPPPPPPPPPCTVAAGTVTLSNATARASALVQGCGTTDVRLTLAAYRHNATSFELLASATLQPVADGTSLQTLQIPTCSTDIVLIRGFAPAT